MGEGAVRPIFYVYPPLISEIHGQSEKKTRKKLAPES